MFEIGTKFQRDSITNSERKTPKIPVQIEEKTRCNRIKEKYRWKNKKTVKMAELDEVSLQSEMTPMSERSQYSFSGQINQNDLNDYEELNAICDYQQLWQLK